MQPDVELMDRLSKQMVKAPPQDHSGLRLGDLIDAIVRILTKYVDFAHRDIPVLIACWIALTYCFEVFQYETPQLRGGAG